MKRLLLTVAVILAALSTLPAQMRVVPLDEQQGHVALGLALRHLANTGIYMMIVAHPDDEDNGLFVELNRGQGYRTTLVTATRGNGGQNEIGPEIFEALGVLRTEELAALHRFDGAEQYFTRAVDFGYSFSVEETLEKWGRDEITGDMVRLIRMIRPDVVSAMTPTGTNGGLHHQTSALLASDAFKIAGDAAKYPEQVKDGLRPWQPRKFYFRAGFGGPNAPPPAGRIARCDLAVYDPLLGRTYSEIGTEARSMHKCQGQAQLLALPGPSVGVYQFAQSAPGAVGQAASGGATEKDERSLFDGIDTSITGLARFVGAATPKDLPRELTSGLAAISSSVQSAQKSFDTAADEAALAPLLAGLHAVRVLRGQLRAMPLDDTARFEIELRLRQKEREFQQAALIASGIRVEALADDGVVVPGQAVKVAVIVANRGATDVVVKQVKFDGFDGDSACTLASVVASGRGTAPAGPSISTFKKDQVGRCEPTLKIPANARTTEPYWHREGDAGRYTFDADAPFGLPYRPTPFYVQVTLAFPGGQEVFDGLPVQHRYEGNIFSGEKRSELLVVPALSVRVSPEIVIVPADSLQPVAPPTAVQPPVQSNAPGTRPRAAAPRVNARGRGARPAAVPPAPPAPPLSTVSREIRVTVVNDTPAATDSVVKLELPQGWTATPVEQPVTFSRQDEAQTVRFTIKPVASLQQGDFRVKAVATAGATAGGQAFDRGYQVIEYPHIRRQHIYDQAATTVKVLDVRTAPNMTLGYVMGVGDQVPAAIEQLGVKVEMITPEDLAWGNLSRFDTIMTGVRAYERRVDLRANNSRLLDYVRDGGTLVVQYNKFEFNDAQYGPFPAKVSSNRVTDEFAPVQILEPDSLVFHLPNDIGDAAWKGWKQERGLYFLGEKDSRYRDLLEMTDPFPNNPGVKRGALVEASYGKGHWIYVGLGLWRELPAGVDGAYALLANLISFGKTSALRTVPAPR